MKQLDSIPLPPAPPARSPRSLYAAAGEEALKGRNVLIVDPALPHSLFGGTGDRVTAFAMIGSGMIWRTRPTFPGLAALATAADAVFWIGSPDAPPLCRVSVPVAPSLDLEFLVEIMAMCRRISEVRHGVMQTIESLAVAASQPQPTAAAVAS